MDELGPPKADLTQSSVPSTSPGAPRPGRWTSPLVGCLAVLVALLFVVAVLFTVPLNSRTETSVRWIGWKGATPGGVGGNEGWAVYQYGIFNTSFCKPANAVGNLTLSFVWTSTYANTTARFLWGVFAQVANYIYYVNDSSDGGYSFPSNLMAFLCETRNPVLFEWYTPMPGALITLEGVLAYNYTTTVPLW
jgi:hypothetical protein